MTSTWLLAWRYVSRHRFKSGVLIASLVLTACLPVAAQLLLGEFERQLTARADATPLVVGARGSRFDLVLHALYFEVSTPQRTSMREVERIRESGYAEAIPLHAGFTAREFPIVGTTLAYFDFRGLEVAEGTMLARLGDCVLGAKVADELGLGPGDKLPSDAIEAFSLTGPYPLLMRVTGVLEETGTGDDFAVFVDVKTAWVIEGIGHGHEELSETAQPGAVLRREDNEVVGSPALFQYREITDENVASFHFHGEPEDFPLTAIVAVPPDEASATKLMGRYLADDEPSQVLVPRETIAELTAMVFKVKRLYDANTALVAVATTLFLTLVVLLSLQLRARERRTMFKIGCSRWTIAKLQAAELAIVVGLGAVVVAIVVSITMWYADDLMRVFLFGS